MAVLANLPSRPAPAMPSATTPELQLISRVGPSSVRRTLVPPGPHRIGRRPEHSLPLGDDPSISRDHAELEFRPDDGGGRWTITDLGSRHGTRVNGLRVPSQRPVPLSPGDLVGIGAYELQLGRADDDSRIVARTIEESAEGISSRPASSANPAALAQHRLGLLLELSERLHSAEDPAALARLLADAAVDGTGLANAAVLGLPDAEGGVEVLASCGAIESKGAPRLSRSLLRRAAAGQLAVSSGGSALQSDSHSIIDLGIATAAGAPILVGDAVVAILYADRRGDAERRSASTDAAEFLGALARIGGVALAGLRRIELERRYRDLEADLAIAGVAHRTLLRDLDEPLIGLRVEGRSRPGRVVGGDLFLVLVRGERLRVVLGDVSGKGVGAAVLMSAAHGFLRAELGRLDSIEAVAASLGEFVERHRHGNTFLTTWIAEIDPAAGAIRYVDAGHGYALLDRGDRLEWLQEGGGPPLGAAPGVEYGASSTAWSKSDRLLVVSDGLVEQPSPPGAGDREEFGRPRVEAWLAAARRGSTASTRLSGLFDAVSTFGGGPLLADDATAILIEG
ncbi:MAG: FHA domain-containing protein [Phycisphaerae bacterium]|nr:FHA domain-containing protein [Phycisphaerae bacterium]